MKILSVNKPSKLIELLIDHNTIIVINGHISSYTGFIEPAQKKRILKTYYAIIG